MRPADLTRALPTRTAARGSRARLRSTAAALLVALLAAAPAAVAAPVPDAGSTAGGTRVELEVPGSTYALVGAGAATSFAVTDDGRLWGTGRNDHGQLGDGTTTDRTVRTPVTGVPGTITEITGGSAHTLARTADGRVWSWGLGSSGQLGNGASSSRATPGQVGGFGGHDVLTVSAGDAHNLAVDALGRPWAWGSNSHGQLGYTTSVPGASLPVGVPTMAGRTITAVAAGASHSLALQDDGTVWAWGRGDYGQLGDGQGTSTDVPVQATGWGARTVVAIAAGGDTSAAVASDGTLWMWGAGGWGQLGDGAIGSSAASAQQVTALAGVRVTSVALSTTTAVALGADGSVWTWGGVGTLGDPSRPLGDAPRKVAVLAGSTVTAAAAEGFHASALTDAGTLWSWGLNTSGAIGDGTTGDAGLPVRARSPLQVREARFDGLAGTDLVALDDARVAVTTPAHGAGSVGVELATVLRDGTTPGPDLTVPGAFLYVVPPPAPAPRAASASHVRGTGPAGTDVVIRDGLGSTVGTAPVAADGSFDVALAPAQAHGATLTVTAVDSHGIPSAPATVTVDAVAPAAPAIGPTDGSVLRGTAEPGSLVTVRSGSRGVVASVTAGADGSWSLAPAPALPRGDRAAADARDVAGNVSPEAARRVGLPVVPADQTLTTGTTGQVTATDLQPGERVAASLFSKELRLGEATADADGVVTFTVALAAGFAPGAHELVLTGPASGRVTGSIRVLAATGTAGTGTDPGSGGTAGAGVAPGPGAAARGSGAGGLAWTGAETGTALAGAAALIALGGVLVRSRRAAAGTPPR